MGKWREIKTSDGRVVGWSENREWREEKNRLMFSQFDDKLTKQEKSQNQYKLMQMIREESDEFHNSVMNKIGLGKKCESSYPAEETSLLTRLFNWFSTGLKSQS